MTNNQSITIGSALPAINFRVNTSPATVGSVFIEVFGTNGTTYTKTIVENTAPYASHGDVSGSYNDWIPANGSYSIRATPYSGAGRTGTVGTALTLAFTVNRTVATVTTLSVQPRESRQRPTDPALKVFPTPTLDGRVKVLLPAAVQGEVTYSLMSVGGLRLMSGKLSLKQASSLLEFDLSASMQAVGVYYLHLEGATGSRVLKLMRH